MQSDKKYAYVWLIMKGDAYLPGLFASIYSVIKTKTNYDLIVMYTDDVSNHAINILSKLATCIKVPYIIYKTGNLKTQRQQKLYSTWLNCSYTKWNLLNLTEYSKVLFLDGDTIIMQNIDHLFEMSTPAAPFNSPFVYPLGRITQCFTNKKGTDGYIQHNDIINNKEVFNALTKNGLVLTASTVLLTPNKKDFVLLTDYLSNSQPFGFPKCHSMVDEQAIVYFYSFIKNTQWSNIHHKYNLISWKSNFLSDSDEIYVLHYFAETKPWNMKINEYPDVKIFYEVLLEAMKTYSLTADNLLVNKNNFITE